jgi:hypothetical protein
MPILGWNKYKSRFSRPQPANNIWVINIMQLLMFDLIEDEELIYRNTHRGKQHFERKTG